MNGTLYSSYPLGDVMSSERKKCVRLSRCSISVTFLSISFLMDEDNEAQKDKYSQLRATKKGVEGLTFVSCCGPPFPADFIT